MTKIHLFYLLCEENFGEGREDTDRENNNNNTKLCVNLQNGTEKQAGRGREGEKER